MVPAFVDMWWAVQVGGKCCRPPTRRERRPRHQKSAADPKVGNVCYLKENRPSRTSAIISLLELKSVLVKSQTLATLAMSLVAGKVHGAHRKRLTPPAPHRPALCQARGGGFTAHKMQNYTLCSQTDLVFFSLSPLASRRLSVKRGGVGAAYFWPRNQKFKVDLADFWSLFPRPFLGTDLCLPAHNASQYLWWRRWQSRGT